jgi:hypothetical protein
VVFLPSSLPVGLVGRIATAGTAIKSKKFSLGKRNDVFASQYLIFEQKKQAMKKWCLMILVGGMIMSCEKDDFNITPETDLQTDNLYGNVKSVLEVIYYAKDDTSVAIKDRVWSSSFTKYNERGYKTEKSEYDEHGHLRYTETYYFDSAGRPILKRKIEYDGTLLSYDSFLYNEAGQLIEFFNFYRTNISRWVIKYNNKGIIVQEDQYYNAQFLRRILYTYDSKNRISSITTFDKDSKYDGKDLYEYDRKGNMTVTWYNSKDEVTGGMTYKYDERGNLIYSDGGSCISFTFSFKYIFDDEGNWFSCVRYHGNEPDVIYERQIKYY